MIYIDPYKSDILNQYMMFLKITDEKISEMGYSKDVLEKIVEKCINDNILSEFLARRKQEMISIMDLLFDQEKVLTAYLESEIEEGRAEGRAEGIEQERLASGIKAVEKVMKNFSVDLETAISSLELEDEIAVKVRSHFNRS